MNSGAVADTCGASSSPDDISESGAVRSGAGYGHPLDTGVLTQLAGDLIAAFPGEMIPGYAWLANQARNGRLLPYVRKVGGQWRYRKGHVRLIGERIGLKRVQPAA